MGLHVKKGDKVVIISGKDKGKSGEVLEARPKENRVVVAGCNIIKRHTRPSQANPQGGIIERPAPIQVSNVLHADPKDGKPTRVGMKLLDDGRKVRVAKRSGEVIDR